MYSAIKYSRRLTALMLAGSLAAVVAATAPALADDIRSERVQFAKGTSGTTIKDRIKGYETVDYKLGARAGQHMTVTLETDNTSNYFNVMAPGETEVAFFIGSTEGERFEGELPANGDYTIRVYLMRNAARRNETAHYRLDVSIAAKTDRPSAANSQDALVPGTDFHATGEISCSMGSGQRSGSCPFGVKREGNGSGMVTVTKPDGRTRVIFFDRGEAIGYDESQADPAEFDAERQSDITIIYIGEERYEIFDAVIYGG